MKLISFYIAVDIASIKCFVSYLSTSKMSMHEIELQLQELNKTGSENYSFIDTYPSIRWLPLFNPMKFRSAMTKILFYF